MIYTVTLNPALDKTVEIPDFTIDAVNRVTSARSDPGGKGINVSKVIQKLGSRSIAMGILSGSTGQMILHAVQELGIETDFLMGEGETRMNLKVVDPVCHTFTDINEPGTFFSERETSSLLKKLQEKIKEGDIVILSGRVPQGAPEDTYRKWTTACAERGAKVFLDADGIQMAEGIKASPYLIKPNDRELSELMGRELTDRGAQETAARELIDQYGIRKVAVSLGKEGVLYVTEDMTIYAKGLDVPVKSTVGAGDSVVAALAVAEENGSSPEEAARLSMATGAANVMTDGSQPPEHDLVRELMPKVVLHKWKKGEKY